MMNPKRLTLARQRRGCTKKDLAEAIGVTPRTITAYERDEFSPEPETLKGIAATLRFPVAFFELEEPPEPSLDSVSFRSLARMSARTRDRAEAAGIQGIELSRWIDDRFDLPSPNVPDLRYLDPAAAAESLRGAWGAGERPIRNVVNLLEANGIRVFSLAEDCLDVDAFSLWDDDRPFVFLNTRKSVERSRYDAAHEVAHLTMHRHAGLRSRDVEREANAFAASFLMPEAGVTAQLTGGNPLAAIMNGKEHWGVAAMAFARRLHDLGFLTEWRYRRCCKSLSKMGFRSGEPNSRRLRETSQVMHKVFQQLRATGVSRRDVARELAIPVDDLNALLFGLVMTVHGGGGRVDAAGAARGHLSEVK